MKSKSNASTTTIVLILTALFVLSACDSVDSDGLDNPIVVEAFLFAGEPIDDIHLSSVLAIDSDDTLATPINDADVHLIKEGVSYTLIPSGTAGFYHYAGDDLKVETGDVFQLEVNHGSTQITAETTVPASPTGVAMPLSRIVVPTVGDDFRAVRELFQVLSQDNTLSVTWDNPEEESYFVALEAPPDDNPDYLLPEFVRDRFGGFRIVTEPTTANFFDIPIFSLEVIGTYETTVYRINQEYVDLYENREQDSRDLNEPPTNIEGGLGVFSAFNGESITFQIIRNEG